MFLHALALALTGALTPSAADVPPIFGERAYDAAVQQATAEDRLLLVDFTASWCAPCHRMDATTWVDDAVVAWVDEHAVAVQVDVDEQRDVAQEFSVAAMPTVVLVRDGDVVDRITGYRDAAGLLVWLDGVLAGRTELDGLRKTEDTNVAGRYELAQVLTRRGEYEEATRHFAWLWQHALEHDASYSGVRVSFMASSIADLVQKHEPAREVFTGFFDEARASLEAGEGNRLVWRDWRVLGEKILGRGPDLIAWIAENVGTDGSLFEASEDERADLLPLLVEHGRAELAARLIPDLAARARQRIEADARFMSQVAAMADRLPPDFADMRRRSQREELLRLHLVALAADRDLQAEAIEEAFVAAHDRASVRLDLVRQVLDVGRAEQRHVRLAAEAVMLAEDDGEARVAEALMERVEDEAGG